MSYFIWILVNIFASVLILIGLVSYYFVVFKPCQDEKALKQNEFKELNRIRNIEEWEEQLRAE